MLLSRRSHLALCSLAVQKFTLCMCFSSEYFRRGADKMQAETDRWWPPSHCLLLLSLSLSVPLPPPCAHRTFSEASPLFLSLSSQSHHSLFSLPSLSHPCLNSSVIPCFSHPFPPDTPFIPLIYSRASSPLSYLSLLSFFFVSPQSCTLSACPPVSLFQKGLSEASALLIHSPCIASHICRVRQTDREERRRRRRGDPEEERGRGTKKRGHKKEAVLSPRNRKPEPDPVPQSYTQH